MTIKAGNITSLAGLSFYTANSTCRFVQIVHFFSIKQMNKCIIMGVTAFKIVICGGKSWVLWLQIMF